ncbi:MAG TPA: hypothetical protein VKE22_20300 [Haliangiales bacterium]|nr:hypothetical protein [Haliangiales bacterium]
MAALAWGAAACAGSRDGAPAAAAGATNDQGEPSRYHVIKLPTLGGASAGNSINNLFWVSGQSNLAGDQIMRASLWLFGFFQIDLGTLGGPNSAVLWPVKNNRGLISGVAETADLDPLGEEWSCSAFFPTSTGHICRGFVWERGKMRGLPTLGGNNGFATGTNNLGQTVGWAENTVRDPTCNPPQVLQFRAVIWGPERDQIQELPPLRGDTSSSATAINDRGQVVGISGICSNAVGGFTAAHAVMWQNGVPTDLGSLGGIAWNTPMAMNQRGDVVGFANVANTSPPGHFNAHAFLWTQDDGIRDLGTLPGDLKSQALGINEQRQVVGISCLGAACRAFLWQDGVMTDLNDRIASGSRDHLFFANDIDDFGAITGQSISATGDARAFLAVPTED